MIVGVLLSGDRCSCLAWCDVYCAYIMIVLNLSIHAISQSQF
jgi:hypothetical protein